MSTSELQACLARLYVDESFRRLFYLQPDVLSDYLLDASEREAVERIDRRLLEFFAMSLQRKRRERIARAYPAIFRLDGKALDRYWRRYCAIFTAHDGSTFDEEVTTFGTFIWELLAEDAELPPYARDLVRFEQEDFRTRSHSRRMQAIERRPASTPLGPTSRPYLAEGVTLHRFTYDIPVIEDALRQHGPDAAASLAEPGDYALVFFPPTELAGSAAIRLNAPLALVPSDATGTQPYRISLRISKPACTRRRYWNQ